jgi:hypothetical protein
VGQLSCPASKKKAAQAGRPTGRMLGDALSAYVGADTNPDTALRWGDVATAVIVGVARRDLGLRTAVPLVPLTERFWGGGKALGKNFERLAEALVEQGLQPVEAVREIVRNNATVPRVPACQTGGRLHARLEGFARGVGAAPGGEWEEVS